MPDARLGWLLLVIGAITWPMFGQRADWSSLLFLRTQLAQANGIVRDASRTGLTSGDETNGAPIHSVHFEFADSAGRQWKGTSWTEGRSPRRGDEGGGFWAVGLIGRNVIWYNDIEGGFNISSFTTFGSIGAYYCNQGSLQPVLYDLAQWLMVGDAPSARLGPPEQISEP